jgi:hypothetical protein
VFGTYRLRARKWQNGANPAAVSPPGMRGF